MSDREQCEHCASDLSAVHGPIRDLYFTGPTIVPTMMSRIETLTCPACGFVSQRRLQPEFQLMESCCR